MSQELNLMFRVEDYQMAQGAAEVNELLEKGYEPYGDPTFVEGDYQKGDGVGIYHYQAMVKRAPFTPKAYLDVVKGMMLAVVKLQSGNMEDLFTDAEKADINEMFGEEVF